MNVRQPLRGDAGVMISVKRMNLEVAMVLPKDAESHFVVPCVPETTQTRQSPSSLPKPLAGPDFPVFLTLD